MTQAELQLGSCKPIGVGCTTELSLFINWADHESCLCFNGLVVSAFRKLYIKLALYCMSLWYMLDWISWKVFLNIICGSEDLLCVGLLCK